MFTERVLNIYKRRARTDAAVVGGFGRGRYEDDEVGAGFGNNDAATAAKLNPAAMLAPFAATLRSSRRFSVAGARPTNEPMFCPG